MQRKVIVGDQVYAYRLSFDLSWARAAKQPWVQKLSPKTGEGEVLSLTSVDPQFLT